MVCVLADTYRRYFKLALAYPRDTGQNADRWAVIQLQTAIHAAIAWIGDWYVLACDGENRTLVILDNVPVGPGRSMSLSFILRHQRHLGELPLGYLEFLFRTSALEC